MRMSGELKANSLSFIESIVMGVAGSAPGFSIAVAIAGLVTVAGYFSLDAVLIFALPMLGIALGYKGLNRKLANAGAAYEWTRIGFGRLPGFYSGWALLIASMVFMVTGSVPLGTATIDLFDPSLASHVLLTTGIGAIWFMGIGLVLIAGIEITSKVQLVMSSIELLILFVISAAALLRAATGHAGHVFSWTWLGFHTSRASFASSALIVVFLYWGWDVTASSFMPSIASILADSVNAIAVQVSYYYGLAGLVCAWAYRRSYRESAVDFLQYAVAPALSAVALIALGIYAVSTFNVTTRIVGIGGLVAGILFFRPGGYRTTAEPASVS